MPEDPERVEQDTDDWRGQADLVLSYWRDHIEAAPGGQVLSKDLLADFKLWLAHGGHTVPWPDRLFNMRFESHEETLRHKVTVARVTVDPGKLSRPVCTFAEDTPRGQQRMWIGLKFRSNEEERSWSPKD